jgi:L-amino acid N-acyltransferase YncA
MSGITIRSARREDFAAMWPIFEAVVATGDTYVFAPSSSRADAFDYWFGPGVASYVAEVDGGIAGMYKLVANQRDLGSHVANASFMVRPALHGAGIGRAMAVHCLEQAKAAGFLAMQFNFVVSTNERALALWNALGFSIVGTLPRAFRHRTLGYVDAHVLYRPLEDVEA